jgi:hypothetical protein
LASRVFAEELSMSRPLLRTKVYRAGVTSRYQFPEASKVRVSSAGNFAEHAGDVRLSFAIDSKGGGKTAISLYIDPQDCLAMLRVLRGEQRQRALTRAAQELRRQEREDRKLRQRLSRMRKTR